MQSIISIKQEDEQAPLLIQRDVGIALRLSFEAVTREPLPEQMALLLLRLALAQSLRVYSSSERETDEENDNSPSNRWEGIAARVDATSRRLRNWASHRRVERPSHPSVATLAVIEAKGWPQT